MEKLQVGVMGGLSRDGGDLRGVQEVWQMGCGSSKDGRSRQGHRGVGSIR